MATLVFGSIGTALGGPLGGAIGALVGRQADTALFGAPGRQGPRLRELDVSLSSYGQAIPRIHGRMRTAGAVIWATELQEHVETRGTGLGQPSVTTYSYSANFAVVLSSRRIDGIGRIWADGKLLRGAAGDLKVGGTLRIHRGTEDQPADPLIAADQGDAHCPAFRGLAYVVFEGLELATFGSRMPALTFEVIADASARLADLITEALPGSAVLGEAPTLAGFCIEDTVQASLAQLQPVLPITLDAAAEALVVRVSQGGEATTLDDTAAAVGDDTLSSATGITHRRAPHDPQPAPVLRYFDIDRDYQAGAQHAAGRAGVGQAATIDLPAALRPSQARQFVEDLSRRRKRARDQIAWRTCTLDPAVAPGALVRLPGQTGTWQVETWEWRETGVELELSRVDTSAAYPLLSAEAAAFLAPADRPAARTRLVAFELPWDGAGGAPDAPRIAAAVGADGLGWSGAALFADEGDGQLRPLGSSLRNRAVVGTALDILPPASPLLIDRTSHLTLALASSDHALASASLMALSQGANLALVGEELIQFANAEPQGQGVWRLSHLLRGCAGTEAAIATHGTDEPFALVDPRLSRLDAAPPASLTTILALGHGDPEPVAAALLLQGLGHRPLAPVHPRAEHLPDGSLRLEWTRRARGGWPWSDGVDMPLGEETERYVVSLEAASGQRGNSPPLRGWTLNVPYLVMSYDELAGLAALAPGGVLRVRQQGTRALSHPLLLAHLGPAHITRSMR